MNRSLIDFTCDNEDCKGDHDRITQIQQGRAKPFDLQIGHKVVQAIGKDIKRCGSGCQETSPPPIVILKDSQSLLKTKHVKISRTRRN